MFRRCLAASCWIAFENQRPAYRTACKRKIAFFDCGNRAVDIGLTYRLHRHCRGCKLRPIAEMVAVVAAGTTQYSLLTVPSLR